MRHGADVLTYSSVLDLWEQDVAFRSFFNARLAESPFSAFRWETPAVTAATVDRPFEFVLIDSPSLARRSDRSAFAEHFDKENDTGVVTFPNLGRNAVLVVPCPQGPDEAYGHLAAFVRAAPASQCDVLWRAVAQAMRARIGARPVWLSTAGAGVAWLHVRLDDSPKYYAYQPYRTP